MPERYSKRKTRRDSSSSSLGEPEASSLRTENVTSISNRDISELSQKIEKSVCHRIKDTETGEWEILKMIEILSSKIYSLTNKTPSVVDTEIAETNLTEPGSSSQRADTYELPHYQGQHKYIKSVFVEKEAERKVFSWSHPLCCLKHIGLMILFLQR